MGYTANVTNEGLPRIERTAGFVGVLLAVVGGLSGNFIAVTSVCLRRGIAKSTRLHIVSLGIPDVLFLGLLCSVMLDTFLWNFWRFGEVLCHVYTVANLSLYGCSMLHQALIALQIYLRIVRNKHFLHKTWSWVCASVLCWLLPPASLIPTMYEEFREHHYDNLGTKCVFISDSELYQKIISLILFMILPCSIMIFSYLSVFIYNSQLSKTLRSFGGNMAQERLRHREVRMARMFASICAIGFFGYAPFAIMRSADPGFKFPIWAYVLTTVLYCCSIALNVIVYGIFSSEIRRGYKILMWKLITMVTGMKPPDSSQENGSSEYTGSVSFISVGGKPIDGAVNRSRSCDTVVTWVETRK